MATSKSGGLKAKLETKLRQWPWAWHAYQGWTTLKSRNGTQYSAAITYFSFLALFPLLLLAAAITGFVLSSAVGIAPVWVGNREGYIDKHGKYIWNPMS